MTENQKAIESHLLELLEQNKNGQLCGLTVVTTNASGAVSMNVVALPESTS